MLAGNSDSLDFRKTLSLKQNRLPPIVTDNCPMDFLRPFQQMLKTTRVSIEILTIPAFFIFPVHDISYLLLYVLQF
jgi:hypothetical protein